MGIKLKYPVVLCHGFLALGNFSWQRTNMFGYFTKIRKVIEPKSIKVYEPIVAPSDKVEKRADELNAFIKKEIEEEMVHLVCHSMGGLDARLLASKLDQKDRIISITTIATPHHGTPFADWCVDKIYHPRVNNFLNLLGITLAGIYNLTTEGAFLFNESTPDNPNVRYFSFSSMQSIYKITPIFIFPSRIISKADKDNPDNDGLVPEYSSHWTGYVNKIYADHLGTLGYITMPNAKEDFDYKNFYADLINLLAQTEN